MLALTGVRPYTMSVTVLRANRSDFATSINPQSMEILTDCRVEMALACRNEEGAVQFERQGYFCPDPDSAPGRLVFNRTVGLRDTWAKVQAAGG